MVISRDVSRPTFSVIIPTAGRPTLAATLERLQRANRGDIEILVVTDGEQPVAEEIASRLDVSLIRGPATHRWGNAQRQLGVELARGRYLLFIDDDDVHTRHAFRHLRRAVSRTPNRIILFRMRRRGSILWQTTQLESGNVGTPEFVIPNVPGKLGSWIATDERYESDFDFVSSCVEKQGEPIWDSHVIALAPPFSAVEWLRHKVALRTRLRRLLRR